MSESTPMNAPQRLKVLFTVVDVKKTEYYADLLRDLDANLQVSILGNGTAKEDTLRYLGLKADHKVVLISVLREDQVKKALALLEEKFATVRNGKGVAWTVPLTGMVGVTAYRFLSNAR